MPVNNPMKDLPMHLTTYPNPIEERKKLGEYIKLLHQEEEQTSPNFLSLNFIHFNNWANILPHQNEVPIEHHTPTSVPNSFPKISN